MKLFTISGQLCIKAFPKLKMALDAVSLNTRDLKIECFFDISRERQTSRSHVTSTLPSGLRLDHAPAVSCDLPQGFLHTLKHHTPTFERKYSFLELFR